MRWQSLAADQDGVVSRRQLREVGFDRHAVRTQLRASRWQKPSPHTVATFTGALAARQRWWVALLETGCADAVLDGVTALTAAGLTGFDGPITVSCPRGAKPRRLPGVDLRLSRWRYPGDHLNPGIPRARPEVAAVRGSLWARTHRQGALILVMAVQQRLTTARRVERELARIARHPRRPLMLRVVADLVDGAQALGELDFAAWCRRYGLPKPSRQVLRCVAGGTAYLDVYFDDYGLVVEIDGIHHLLAANRLRDALRHNDVTLSADTVLQVPLLGLRVAPEAFMTQVARGLRDRGWRDAG